MPGLLGNPAAMSEHLHEDDLEERDDLRDIFALERSDPAHVRLPSSAGP